MKQTIFAILLLHILLCNGFAQKTIKQFELNFSTGLAFEEFKYAIHSAAFDQLSLGVSYYPLQSLELNLYGGVHYTDECAYDIEKMYFARGDYRKTFTLGFVGNFHPLSLLMKQQRLRIDPYLGLRYQLMQQPVEHMIRTEPYFAPFQETVLTHTCHAGFAIYPLKRIGIAADYTFGGFNVYERVFIHLKYRF